MFLLFIPVLFPLDVAMFPCDLKVKKGEIMVEGGIHYLELYQPLLLLYCQAITFYLLLKSELKDVRDHPVVARLVEIKSLLDKVVPIFFFPPNRLCMKFITAFPKLGHD